jgi:transposase-like protein
MRNPVVFRQGGWAVGKKYIVELAAEERDELERVVTRGKAAGWKIQRCQALLKGDQGRDGPAWPDERIAEAFGCTTRSLESWRKQAVERGPLSLLERKPRPIDPRQLKLDGEKEARLVTLACSAPPQGHARWSLRLLAERLVELKVVESVSHETVRRAMKKTS